MRTRRSGASLGVQQWPECRPAVVHTASAPLVLEAKEPDMAISETDRKVVTTEPATAAGSQTVQTESRHTTSTGPGGAEFSRRMIVLAFGLIQLVLGARIVLLLLDAREGNAIVSTILGISEVLVAPFEGMLRTDALARGGSILDVTAIVAIVGWTILELVLIWVVGVFRHRSAGTTA
jgi:hypothetical protein